VKALSTPLVESKCRLCYAHVTVSRLYRTTDCIFDLEKNEFVVSPSTHFPQSGGHLKTFKSPSISWYLETVSPQKANKYRLQALWSVGIRTLSRMLLPHVRSLPMCFQHFPALQNIKPQERRRLLKDAVSRLMSSPAQEQTMDAVYKRKKGFFFFLIFYFFAFLCFLSAPCSNVVLSACTTMPDRRSLLLTIKVSHYLQEKVNNE